MPRVTGADDRPGFHIQRREQRRRPVPHVVVRAAGRQARTHRQQRRGAIERLDLALLVHAEHQGAIRRMQIQPDDVAHFVDEQRILRQLERLGPMRLQRERFPDARDRRLTQPFVFRQVPGAPVGRIARRRLERRGDRAFNLRVGNFPRRPGRGSSSNPAIRVATNRLRHLPTVWIVTSRSAAIAVCVAPVAHRSTIARAEGQALRRRRPARILLKRRAFRRDSGRIPGPGGQLACGVLQLVHHVRICTAIIVSRLF